jgi:YVTN family beta-propeller protein
MKKLALALMLACLFAPASTRAQNAYITNQGSSTVSVIDTATDTIIATIPVGLNPFGVAVSPDGSKVYVANVSSNTVSVIDTATNTVNATIPVGLPPPPPPFCGPVCAMAVAVSPDGNKVYVTNTFSNSNTVSVIDTTTNTVSATIPVGRPSLGVAVTPDGSKVYVANADAGTVSVIDTATNMVSVTISSVGGRAFGVAVSPDGSKVYVTDSFALFHSVSVIDSATNTVIATTGDRIAGGAFGVAVSPDGSKVYVTNGDSDTAEVIDTATNTVIATIFVRGFSPIGVAVKPDGSKVYVANLESGTVSVIDTAANAVGAQVAVGNGPAAFGVFIQPPPRPGQPPPTFAGVVGSENCHGTSVSALATKFGGLDAAAAALGFSNVQGLQDAIRAFCEG